MLKYEINNIVDLYIEKLAFSGIVNSFYPNVISKKFNIPLTLVLERLNRLIEDDILNLKFEIRCNKCSHIIDIIDDYAKYVGKEEYCMCCDDEEYIDLSNISPIYYINDEYKEYLKKKKKMSLKNYQGLQSQELAMV